MNIIRELEPRLVLGMNGLAQGFGAQQFPLHVLPHTIRVRIHGDQTMHTRIVHSSSARADKCGTAVCRTLVEATAGGAAGPFSNDELAPRTIIAYVAADSSLLELCASSLNVRGTSSGLEAGVVKAAPFEDSGHTGIPSTGLGMGFGAPAMQGFLSSRAELCFKTNHMVLNLRY